MFKQTDKGVSQGLFGDGGPVGWGAVESRGGVPEVVGEEWGVNLCERGGGKGGKVGVR